jgi:hypothetical protein
MSNRGRRLWNFEMATLSHSMRRLFHFADVINHVYQCPVKLLSYHISRSAKKKEMVASIANLGVIACEV